MKTILLRIKQFFCNHTFSNYRFVKGGGRQATCTKCGKIIRIEK